MGNNDRGDMMIEHSTIHDEIDTRAIWLTEHSPTLGDALDESNLDAWNAVVEALQEVLILTDRCACEAFCTRAQTVACDQLQWTLGCIELALVDVDVKDLC
jgi:hypothetical protein